MTEAQTLAPSFVVTAPETMRGQGFALEAEQLTIGRAIENDVRVDDPHVSRRHAVIRRMNGDVVIEDAASSSGIIVNDRRVAKARVLRAGDRVRLGSVELEMRDAAVPPPAQPWPPARTPAMPSNMTRPGRRLIPGGVTLLLIGLAIAGFGYARWAGPILRCINQGQDATTPAGSCIDLAALLVTAAGGLLVTAGTVMAVVGVYLRRRCRRDQVSA